MEKLIESMDRLSEAIDSLVVCFNRGDLEPLADIATQLEQINDRMVN